MNKQAVSSIHARIGRGEIALRAYELWRVAGRPTGRDLEFWFQAEAELLASRRSRLPKAVATEGGAERESAPAHVPANPRVGAEKRRKGGVASGPIEASEPKFRSRSSAYGARLRPPPSRPAGV